MNEADLALTKFAMGMQLISMEQLEKCVELQQTLQIPMGTVFLGKKLISEQQYDLLVEKVKEEQRRQDIIFAKVALALHYLTAEQLEEAQEIQAQSETAESLDDILLGKNILSQDQIKTILTNVHATKIMICPKCSKKYSMTPYQVSKVYNCSSCEGVLELVEEEKIESMLVSRFSWQEPNGDETPLLGIDNSPLRATLTDQDLEPEEQKRKSSSDMLKTPSEMEESKNPLDAELEKSPVDGDTHPEINLGKTLGREIFTKRGDRKDTQTRIEQLHFMGAAKDLQLKLQQHKQDELCGTSMGDYMILERIGAGAMGVVYKAEQIKLQRIVAIKMLSSTLCGDDFYIQRFLVEARSAAKLNHPNIVQIYDADICNDRLFYSMEYIRGETISRIIDRRKRIPAKNCLDIILQTAHALVETYEAGIVHRDIKPENILLTVKGIAKLADLGLARNVDYAKELEAVESGMMMGTPYYVAPEQITNPNNVDCRTDIYSLGASFYAMITGIIPFVHPDPRVVLMRVIKNPLTPAMDIVGDVPPALSWVIGKMVEKRPEDRFQTPLELIDVLEGLQSNLAEKRAPIMQPDQMLVDIASAPSTPRPGTKKIPPISSSATLTPTPPPETRIPKLPTQKTAAAITFADETPRLPKPPVHAPTMLAPRAMEPAKPDVSKSKPPMKQEPISRKHGKAEDHKTPSKIPIMGKKSKEQAEEKDSVLPLIGSIALILIIIGAIFYIASSNSTPSKPINPHNTMEIPLSADQALKQSYTKLKDKMQKFFQNPLAYSEKEVQDEINGFVNTYSSSTEKEEILHSWQEFQQNRKINESQKFYQSLKNDVTEFLKACKFQAAQQKIHDAQKGEWADYLKSELVTLVAMTQNASLQAMEEQQKQAMQLWSQGKFPEAINKLETTNLEYIQQHSTILEQHKKELQQQYAKILLSQETWTLRGKVSPFFRQMNYSKIKETLEAAKSDAATLLLAELGHIIAMNESVADALKSLKEQQDARKEKEFVFEFEGIKDPKDPKKQTVLRVVGKIVSISTNINIKDTRTSANISRSIEKLIWPCKRKILEKWMKFVPQKASELLYSICLFELLQGNFETAKADMKMLGPAQQTILQEACLQLQLLEVKTAILDQQLQQASDSLSQILSAHSQNPSWPYIKYALADWMIQYMSNAATPSNVKQFLRQFIEEQFPATKWAEEAKITAE